MVKKLLNFKKVAILAVALLAVSFGAKAQSWYIMGEYIWSPPNPQGTFNELHYQAEDVEINGMDYHTIYAAGERSLLGAYREEDNQVYYCKWNGSDYDEEVLLYDYDLEEGDFFNDMDDHPMLVTSVTTITDFNGIERKKYDFMFIGLEDETEYWIEGVGSNKGFVNRGVYTPTNQGAIFHLLCYHVGNELIYVNPEYNACDIDDINETLDNVVSIYPNPANNVVRVLSESNTPIRKIEVIDLLGRIVATANNSEFIDVSSLPEGQYLMKVYGETTIMRKLTIAKQ